MGIILYLFDQVPVIQGLDSVIHPLFTWARIYFSFHYVYLCLLISPLVCTIFPIRSEINIHLYKKYFALDIIFRLHLLEYLNFLIICCVLSNQIT